MNGVDNMTTPSPTVLRFPKFEEFKSARTLLRRERPVKARDH